MTKRALIVGGSLAGLSAGLFLLRQGWDVQIYERSTDDMSDQGGGIVTQDSMWDALASVGLQARPGVHLSRRVVYARDGSVVGEQPIEEIVTSWDALYRLLLGAFPQDRYHLGRKVADFDQDAAHVRLRFSDGTGAQGELLVAADGVGSVIRGQVCPDVQPHYANYIAWRGLVPEGEMPALAREALVDAFSFCVAPNEQMLSYTIPGDHGKEEQGHRRHNFVWYRPAEEDSVLQDLLTDANGETHHPNIPAKLIRPEVIAELRRHADATLSPAYSAYVRATTQPSIQPINDHLSRHFAFGRVALVGDAAAQARPHSGAGTSKAIGDAAALAKALAATDDVAAALKHYEEQRYPVAKRLVEHGRWLGQHLDPANGAGGEDQAPDTLLGVSARATVA